MANPQNSAALPRNSAPKAASQISPMTMIAPVAGWLLPALAI